MPPEEWFRRRRVRFPFFDINLPEFYTRDMEDMIRELENRMDEAFRDIEKVPEKLSRERRLPDGSVAREMGPFVYGYSVTVGPYGNPVIREFGNVKPSSRRLGLTVKEAREPLVDVIAEDNQVKVIAEILGVEKKDIKVHASEGSLSINVESPKRPYQKEIEIPADTDPIGATTTYKNGILEITIPRKKSKKPKGVHIRVE
jgi:HSP20 family protein